MRQQRPRRHKGVGVAITQTHTRRKVIEFDAAEGMAYFICDKDVADEDGLLSDRRAFI